MMDFTGFYIMMGLGLLVAGLVGLLKLGLWFWIATRVFHRVPPQPLYQPQMYPAVQAPPSSAKSIKAWLGVIATVLGILTTTVGLVKECSPSQNQTQPASPGYQPPQQQRMGTACCIQGGACPLMMPEPVGGYCICMDMFGNSAAGTVCH
jgi:hypothetical protein